jgi:hypothetical protein
MLVQNTEGKMNIVVRIASVAEREENGETGLEPQQA